MRGWGRLIPLAALVALVAAISIFAGVPNVVDVDGHAARRPARTQPAYPLSRGERGQRVCDALWLLSGRKPAARTSARWHVYRGPIRTGRRCVWNRAAEKATITAKYRLGYKQWQISKTFSRKLRAYLRGERPRPRVYLELQSRRIKLERKLAASEAWAQRLVAAERRELRRCPIGRCEVWGEDRGPLVRIYQLVTGQVNAAWCMSFQQYGRVRAGLHTVAYRTAHVFTFVNYAQRKGWVRAKPAPGFHVAFMERQGHVGLVWRVYRTGIVTIEGNSSDGVRSRFIPHGSRRLIFVRADEKAR